MRIVMELRRRLRAALVAIPLALLFAAPAPAADTLVPGVSRDPSGVGLILPGNLWVSGDVTLQVNVPENQATTFELEDLSLLARWEPYARLAFFSELRFEDMFEATEDEGVVTSGGQVEIERLYAEALLSPALSLRVGKVFTPFGLWNVISRAPLTWTVEEPAVTENVFPQRATGLTLVYQKTWQGWSFDATGYGPGQNQIQFRDAENESLDSGLMFGGRFAAGRDLGPAWAALGLNFAEFTRRESSRWATATGLDLSVDAWGHEITGELTYRIPSDGGGTTHGLYLQDAIPIVRTLHGVLRFEYFKRRNGPDATAQIVGLFWRPIPNLVLKADYIFGTRHLENLETGFQGSFSLLF
jgi:hypothetical protein